MNGTNTRSATDQAWEELCQSADSKVPAQVAKPVVRHAFENVGAGPYKFLGIEAGSSKCADCGKHIKNLYRVQIGNGTIVDVGSECILKLSRTDTKSLVQVAKSAKAKWDSKKREAAKAKKHAAQAALSRESSLQKYPAEVAFLESYVGNSGFLCSLKNQLAKFGGLSEKQWPYVRDAIVQASMPKQAKVFTLAVGETIIVKKFIAKKIGEKTGLNHPHFAIEVLEVKAESAKAYLIVGKLSAQRTSHCCVCGLSLTNAVSVLAGIGPICADRYNVSTTEELHAKLQTQYKATVETWIPKSQIKERKLPVT